VLRSVLSTSEICVSEDLLAEYRAVPDALRAGRKVNAEQWQALVAGIAAFVTEARLVAPVKRVRACRIQRTMWCWNAAAQRERAS
jgi:hypothetical protein